MLSIFKHLVLVIFLIIRVINLTCFSLFINIFCIVNYALINKILLYLLVIRFTGFVWTWILIIQLILFNFMFVILVVSIIFTLIILMITFIITLIGLTILIFNAFRLLPLLGCRFILLYHIAYLKVIIQLFLDLLGFALFR